MAMAALIARAPARLDFGGGWTDVPPYSDEQGGCVCNVAIELHAVATVRELSGDSAASSTDSLSPDNALALAATRRAAMPNVHVHVDAEYPLGAVSAVSSAAGVAVLGALAAWRGEDIAPDCLAEDSRRLEVEDLGIAGGRQDHYAAAMGGALGLWFGGRSPRDAFRCLTSGRRAQSPVRGRVHGAIAHLQQHHHGRDRRVSCPGGRVLGCLDRMRDLAAQMVTALEPAMSTRSGASWASTGSTSARCIRRSPRHSSTPSSPRRDGGRARWKGVRRFGGGCVLAIAAEGREEEVRRAMAAHAQLLTVRVARRGFHVVRQNEPVRAGAASQGHMIPRRVTRSP
jgi:D-glycero-alpha-D-manno-heptose-7-phosphate kinase